MDTKPIFDFILEIQNRKHYVFPKDFSNIRAKRGCARDYFVLLSKMEEEYEACVFQCVAENPKFKEELHVIADKIGNKVYDWKHKQSINKLGKSPYGDSKRVAIQVGEKSLQFLHDNYGVEMKVAELIPIAETAFTEELKNDTQDEETTITGIRNLAKFLNMGVNKANAIVQSGILEKEHIQWNEGYWKFDKAKLIKFREDNPNAFAKIKCKR